MNIKLLKAFITIADTGSFSKAAQLLYISQPALSQNIKQLEAYFTSNLMKRTSHSFALTEAGERLYKHAVNLVAMSDLMEKDMKELRSSFDDTLLVGATSVIGGYAVPCSIFIFKKKHPDATIKLSLGNRRQILDHLEKDFIDIAIVEGDMPSDHFIISEIHTEEMVIVATHSEYWKTHQNLSIEDFLKVPLIMREEGSATRRAIERTFQQAGISLQSLNIVMELNSIDSIKAAVEAGHGISILPRVAVRRDLYTKTLYPLHIDKLIFSQPIHLVYKRKPHRIIASEFIKLMKSSVNGFC
ncbi:MAG: LysR family transcriptional regulator [Sporomusaceae bacterium]|nr:LysR family transcriptional regulator [Sporomusaceae bacterium]